MLHLKKHLTLFASPQSGSPARALMLSPVSDDDDELIQNINNDATLHDDNWQLTPTPDTEQLDSFWNGVVTDIENDPEWIRFDDETE